MCGICDLVAENDCVQDCQGNWGGNAIIDVCNICNSGVQDVSNCIECPISDPADCIGVCGGEAIEDECGVCDGNNSTCEDCANTPNGDSVVNNCAECVSAGDLTCKQGCDGNWVNDGSEILIDDCEICNGDNSPNTGVCDCNGIPNGLSFFDECGNCISNEISWKMQVKASILPFNNSELDVVYDEENYLGGAPNATDGFDGIIIDKIDALIHPPGNWINFFFYHDDWSNATAASCEDFCTKFKEDIRGNSHSEYMDGNTKIWKGFLEYSIYGMATLTLSSTSNIIDVDISISIGTDNFLPILINESIDIPIYPNEPPKEIHIQISNLCY
jgi:hypothetical protein